MIGHGSQSSRTVDFERRSPPRGPSRQDEIRVPRRVIRMEVRHEGNLQVGGLERRDVPVEHSGLGATYHARTEIDQIGAASTTTAVAGPDRSGSGTGVPVPRSTTRVRLADVGSFGGWLALC